jgi:hypothetical protein
VCIVCVCVLCVCALCVLCVYWLCFVCIVCVVCVCVLCVYCVCVCAFVCVCTARRVFRPPAARRLPPEKTNHTHVCESLPATKWHKFRLPQSYEVQVVCPSS